MRGRNRQPVALILAKGKKHLSKQEIADRLDREIHAPSDAISPPAFLTKKQKSEFMDLANRLIELKIMTNLDIDALARFIVARDMFILITKKVNHFDIMGDLDQFNKLSRIQDRYIRQCRVSASDLGLTISSRCRLILPERPVIEERINKFSKFEAKRS